jgi:hypothetical protein
MSGNCAPSAAKKNNAILSDARPKIEMHYGMAILKYAHHSMEGFLSQDRQIKTRLAEVLGKV